MKKFRSVFAIVLFSVVLFALGLGMVWASGTGMTHLMHKFDLWCQPTFIPVSIVLCVVIPWSVLWTMGVANAYMWLVSKPAFSLIALPERY